MKVFTQLLLLCICNILLFYLLHYSSSEIKSFGVKNAYIIVTIVFFSTLVYFILRQTEPESFFFEVSPQRKQCMDEQVMPINTRSCQCCGKGTNGGYPAKYIYNDLIPQGDDWNWGRVDAYGKTSSITPPTESCSSPNCPINTCVNYV